MSLSPVASTLQMTHSCVAHLRSQLGKLIAQAARAGGPNPVVNERLRDVLHQAKLASLPNNIITRNLEKASDKAAGGFTEVRDVCVGGGDIVATLRRRCVDGGKCLHFININYLKPAP